MEYAILNMFTRIGLHIENQNDSPRLYSGLQFASHHSQGLKSIRGDSFHASIAKPRFGMKPEVQRYTIHYSPEASVDLQALLRREPLSVEDRDWLLVRAIRNDDVDVINTLRDTSSDFNAKSTNLEYETNISFAIKQNKPKAVQALLAGGAKIDLPEANGKLPIQAALLNIVSPEILGLLLDKGSRLKGLTEREQQKLRTCRETMPEMEKLLEKQLCKAAVKGDCDELSVLLAAGVNPNASYQGWNAASLAAKYANEDALRLLEAHGSINFFPEMVVTFAKGMLDAKSGARSQDDDSSAEPVASQKEVLKAFLLATPFETKTQ